MPFLILQAALKTIEKKEAKVRTGIDKPLAPSMDASFS